MVRLASTRLRAGVAAETAEVEVAWTTAGEVAAAEATREAVGEIQAAAEAGWEAMQ
jgi:hypothetical protein